MVGIYNGGKILQKEIGWENQRKLHPLSVRVCARFPAHKNPIKLRARSYRQPATLQAALCMNTQYL